MEKIDEKTIVIQTSVSLELLGMLVIGLKQDPNKTIGNFVADFQKCINWNQNDNYSIVNQGVILTHLYGLVVYPKTIFHDKIPKIKLNDIVRKEWGDFKFLALPGKLSEMDKKILGVTVVNSVADLTLEFLIRKIRNSISHSRVEIFKNMDFKFIDEDGSEVIFSIVGIQKFTSQFKKCCISNQWN